MSPVGLAQAHRKQTQGRVSLLQFRGIGWGGGCWLHSLRSPGSQSGRCQKGKVSLVSRWPSSRVRPSLRSQLCCLMGEAKVPVMAPALDLSKCHINCATDGTTRGLCLTDNLSPSHRLIFCVCCFHSTLPILADHFPSRGLILSWICNSIPAMTDGKLN